MRTKFAIAILVVVGSVCSLADAQVASRVANTVTRSADNAAAALTRCPGRVSSLSTEFRAAAGTFGSSGSAAVSGGTAAGSFGGGVSAFGRGNGRSLPAATTIATPKPPAVVPPATPKPAVVNTPKATPKPAVVNTPKATPKPAVVNTPKATPKPAVVNTPKATPKPAVVNTPKATPKPTTPVAQANAPLNPGISAASPGSITTPAPSISPPSHVTWGGQRLLHNRAWDGLYGNLRSPRGAAPGKLATPWQKEAIRSENILRNGLQLRSDLDGVPLVRQGQSIRGSIVPHNAAQIDHIRPRSKGGDNSSPNLQVLSSIQNLDKSDSHR